MSIKDAFIHTFKTLGNYYIYDVNSNSIISTSENVYYCLKNKAEINEKDISGDTLEKLNILKENGFLSSKRMKVIEHPATELMPFHIKSRMNVITLQVTQQCNLRCEYCAYSGTYDNRIHNEKSMSFEIAKKGIDYVISNSSESNRIDIGFYGGEPLLRFDFIKKCVEYAKANTEGKKLQFHMTTNGTILTDEIMKFLVENKFSLLISLDGPEEIHDRNRTFASNGKGTFKTIMKNISKFKSLYKDYVDEYIRFNAVLDGTSDFECTKKFFSEYDDVKDFKVNLSSMAENYSKEDRKVNEDVIISTGYERFKVLLNKIGRLDEKYVSKLFDKEYLRLKDTFYKRALSNEIPDIGHPGGPCMPGIRKLFLNVEGNFYPCERVSELSNIMKIGSITDGLFVDKIQNILNVGKVSEDQCKDCWSYRYCYLCCAYADDKDMLSKDKKIMNCSRVRYGTEENLKEFCFLNEMGCDFEDSDISYFTY